MFDLPQLFTFAPDAMTTGLPSYFNRTAAETPGIYTDGDFARLAVVALADSDWVFSYVDTSGLAATVVTSGPLSGTGSLLATSCVAGGELFQAARYQVFDMPAIFTLAPDPSSNDVPSYFSRAAANTPGIYSDGNFARLAVIRPAMAKGAVPEPASWGMMLMGFSMIAGATRYRRRGTPATPEYPKRTLLLASDHAAISPPATACGFNIIVRRT